MNVQTCASATWKFLTLSVVKRSIITITILCYIFILIYLSITYKKNQSYNKPTGNLVSVSDTVIVQRLATWVNDVGSTCHIDVPYTLSCSTCEWKEHKEYVTCNNHDGK
jgi:hypothetical protein